MILCEVCKIFLGKKSACQNTKHILSRKNVDKKVESLVKKYVNMQEDCIEKLKEFL